MGVVLKIMQQIKKYDNMFQAIRALTFHKSLKTKILVQNSCKVKDLLFSL